jgi:hypothetical protein
MELEPEVPTSARTHKCAIALWDIFWQGFDYSQKVATTKASGSASGSLVGSGTGQRNPKISKPETLNGECDKLADFVVQLQIGALRQAYLTRLYQFETDCLSGSINRSVVTPF